MAATAPRFSRRYLLQAAGLAGLGVAGAPLLTSCGSGSDPGSGPEGRLLLGTTQIMQFDPYLTNTGIHIHTLYTYLIEYAGPDDYTPVPAGATRWEFAPDQRSVTIELRKASFHSGEPVTAADVVAGVERALDPEAGLTLAQPSAFIDKATAVGDREVRVDFVRPTPEEIVLDWMFAFPLVPAKRNDPAKLETEPAGSGPFRLESYAKDRNLVLTKNPDYWEKNRPMLDRVEVRFFNDEDALVAALEAGDVDGAAYLALRHTERLRERYRLVNGAGRMNLFFMNGAIPPFDDKRLRQAVARAINRKRIIEQVSFGASEPIYTAFMPSSPAFDSSYLDSHGYDPAEARALLESSRAERKATAVVGTEPGAMEMLQIIQADLKEIGFELTIDPREQTAFLDALFGGKVQCCVAAQPNNMQSPALVSRGRQMLPTTDNVMMGDAVPQAYVDAIDAAWTALTADDQQAAYRRLNEVLVDEAWAVGICTWPSLFALDTGVKGLTTDPRDFLNLTSTKVACPPRASRRRHLDLIEDLIEYVKGAPVQIPNDSESSQRRAEGLAGNLSTAVFTPFHADGTLALERVEAQADALTRWGSPAAFVAGTAGEGASLSTSERKALVERWCEVARGRLDVLVHVGHTSLVEAQDLAWHAQESGAKGIAAVAPYFHRPGDVDALVAFCARVAEAAPRLPFAYYHIPSATGVTLPASDVLTAAAERIPTFAGIKYAHGDVADLHRCLRLAGDRHQIWIGNAKLLLAAWSLGARAAIGSVYNFAAPLYQRMLDHAARNDLHAARECQYLAQCVIEAAARYGGELAGFKALGSLVGVDCGPCRPPLVSPDQAGLRELRKEMTELGFLEEQADR